MTPSAKETTPPDHILITGAAGFVGSHLLERLLADPRFSNTRFTALDVSFTGASSNRRVRRVAGDLTDSAVLADALSDTPAAVVHLAGILGGAAERDYELARRVNIDGSLLLLEALREQGNTPRVVFASSIAVFGPPLPDFVDDDVKPYPTMTYGAQKLMIETVVEQFSTRGWIDGLAVRLPGIVARRDADARQRAAFLNTVFFAAEAGEDFRLPVGEDGTTWLISVPAVVDDLVHAVLLDPAVIGRRRAFTLPAQVVSIRQLVDALGEVFPDSRGKVSYARDDELHALFATQPRLETATADELGFVHDGDVFRLIDRAIRGDSA